MAAGRIIIPNCMPALDINGNPVAGAKLTFYVNETTTLLPVYTTAALNVAHPNPLSADAAGVFPSIFADTAVAYSVAITDADGLPIIDLRNRDNIKASLYYGDVVAYDPDLAAIAALTSAADKMPYATGAQTWALADLTSFARTLLATASNSAFLTALGQIASSFVNFIQSGTGAVTRTAQAKMRDAVSVKDFGAVGDGVTNDTAAITLALGSGAKGVYFPAGTYLVTSALVPTSNQTLFANNDATIKGNFADALVKIFGFPAAAVSSVTAPIAVLASTFTMASVSGVSVGQEILLYDAVLDEYDVNRIQSISGTTVTTTWPILRAFATAADIRVIPANPLVRVHLRGLTFENSNVSGYGVRLNSSLDCSVEQCRFNEVAYINISAENSIGFRAAQNLFTKPGSSGIGLRITKSCSITDNRIENTQIDEPITLYKANGFATVTGNRVVQYLSGGGSAGNSILLDEDNYYNTIADNTCNGSATYHIYVAVRSSYNTITGNTLVRANQGCIRVAFSSDGNTIDNNVCVGVVDATDPNDGGIATAAIRATAACAGNIIGMGNSFASNAGVNISDLQTSPPATGRVRGAMAKKAADQTAANYSTAPVIAWDAEIYDTNVIHDNSTNNSRFTVPSGVTFVQAGCVVALGSVANPAIFTLALKKNGSTSFNGAVALAQTGTGNPDPEIGATSGPIPCVAGDYFEWQLYCDDPSITVVAARSNAWLTLLQ